MKAILERQLEEQPQKSYHADIKTTEITTNDNNQNRRTQHNDTELVEQTDAETYYDTDVDADNDLVAEVNVKEFTMECLDVVNENNVVDIATMKIVDDAMLMPQHNVYENNNKSCHNKMMGVGDVGELHDESSESGDNDESDSSKSTTAQSNDTTVSADAAAVGDADDSEEENDEAYSLARLYDIEMDCAEEERTIDELVDASNHGQQVQTKRSHSMRVAFGIILRMMLPLANGVMRRFQGIRDVRLLRVLNTIASSRQALTSLFAFAANTISLNLSSVQVSHRIEPILKLLKIRKSRDGIESLPDVPSGMSTAPSTPTTASAPLLCSPLVRQPKGLLSPFPQAGKRKSPTPLPPPPKCCTLNIMAEPPPGQPIRADIVFIHGLHGSLERTWKQGLWENERQPVGFERPPRPPVRPPKRPRHSRTALIHPPHRQKRARFTHHDHHRPTHERNTHPSMADDTFCDAGDSESMCNHFSYMCGEPRDIEVCDGIEYSFPTFRLRMNDNSRLLRADLESMIKDADPSSNECNNGSQPSSIKVAKSKHDKSKNTPKPSPDDPDYSKCWPGDWLPLDCPGVRVIAVNYTTDQYLWRPLWKKKESRSNLIERSREMAELLIKHRVGYGHPIVWVGHSKGGLFVKQIIVDAWESGRPAMAPFWRSARGVFFYSVPHRGSHLASIKAPLLSRSVELIDIEKNSKYLLDLHRRFAGLYHLGLLKIEVFSFVETALTLMSVLYLRIVGVDSADPGIGDVCGIRLDHREICKPRNRDCILYKELVKMINKVC